jgi:hypothetical protein
MHHFVNGYLNALKAQSVKSKKKKDGKRRRHIISTERPSILSCVPNGQQT